jgi:hypothetical protein
MAERIEDFPTDTGWRYPWDDWTDGTAWQLRHGEDFGGTGRQDRHGRDISPTDDFRNRLYTQAKRRGLRVVTRKVVDDGGSEVLRFQFFDDDDI